MECSVYIDDPERLEVAFAELDDGDEAVMGLESQELIACSVEAQGDLMAAFFAVRPQESCTWAPAFAAVFGTLFWASTDGDRHRDAPWALAIDRVDTYCSPQTVARLATQAATIDLDDLNLAFTDFTPDPLGEGWIQDFNDFRAMAGEWLELVASAHQRGQALAIAVWD
jgi:hypothetical protein